MKGCHMKENRGLLEQAAQLLRLWMLDYLFYTVQSLRGNKYIRIAMGDSDS